MKLAVVCSPRVRLRDRGASESALRKKEEGKKVESCPRNMLLQPTFSAYTSHLAT